jgi:hypothetical protein
MSHHDDGSNPLPKSSTIRPPPSGFIDLRLRALEKDYAGSFSVFTRPRKFLGVAEAIGQLER